MNKPTTALKRRPKTTDKASAKASVDNDGGMDWAAFDALTDAEVHAAALTDPDNPPRTREQLARMRRMPRAYSMRRAFRMTQEEFAETFQIPVGTLRDWEQGRTEPDQAAKAYLKVIRADPYFVRQALAHRPGEPSPSGATEPGYVLVRKPL